MTEPLTGDEDTTPPTGREIPPFPWWHFRRALILSGAGYATNTLTHPTPMIRHRQHNTIPWPVFETSEHGPLLTAVARAFNENYRRHNLTPAHWKTLLACEIGMVYRIVTGPVVSIDRQTGKVYRQVAERLCLYRPERPDAVLPYADAPQVIGVRPDLARRYHSEAKKAVEDEWVYLHSGWEQ